MADAGTGTLASVFIDRSFDVAFMLEFPMCARGSRVMAVI